MSIQIRESVLADVVGIAEVHELSWQVGYRGIIHQSFLDDRDLPASIERWKKNLSVGRTDQYKHFVAAREEEIVGFIDVGAARDDDMEDCGEIYSIYLHPDYFSKGLGQRLFEVAKQQALTFGYEMLYVWVLEDNVRGRKFYERMGAVPFENGMKEIEIDGKPYQEMKYHWVNLDEQ